MVTIPKDDIFNLSNLSPYFQILVFKKENYDRGTFKKLIEEKIQTKQKRHKSSKIKWNTETSQLYAAWIQTDEFPSWLETRESIDSNLALPINVENSLLIINDTNSYLYVHASDKTIEDIIKNIFLNDLKQTRVDIKTFYKALAELNLKIKSLGINNTFGAGGTAAEAKSYFGKDAKLSLTPSYDSGYSFSYCLGSNTDEDGNISNFGCSAKKRKFWGSWTDNVTDFLNQCKEIDRLLSSKSNGEFIPFLVQPFEATNPNKLKILGFYLDYAVPAKGIVTPIINHKEIHDWQCQADSARKIVIGDKTSKTEIKISKLNNSDIEFAYVDPNSKAFIAIAHDGEKLGRKKKVDLIDYLHDEENFTILFEEGIAFRERSFWKDNRLSTPFTKDIYTDIYWNDVDIRKEDSPSKDPKKISIAQKTEEYLSSQISALEILAIIKDGGANEAADHMVICKDKIILVHEKFSSKSTAGLRIDDLQVVASQLIKNIRYLFPSAHNSQLDRFFQRARYLDMSCKTPQELGQQISKALSNIDSQNECWIIQPGISKTSLIKKTNNKFHVLLSHLSSICSSNNTKFRLFCSE
ncbi:hypothetical protein V8Z77_12330 [Stutzerimonas stutzeri]|uniref:hypothetical protein n=1 Tax=Stutzerimonas stutzeri TaxID=316 RepID=UPI0031D05A78